MKHVVGDDGANRSFSKSCQSLSSGSHTDDGVSVSLQNLFSQQQIDGVVFNAKNRRLYRIARKPFVETFDKDNPLARGD